MKKKIMMITLSLALMVVATVNLCATDVNWTDAVRFDSKGENSQVVGLAGGVGR